MRKKVIIPIRVGEEENDNTSHDHLHFDPMTFAELVATIRLMNPTMSSYCLKRKGHICGAKDKLLDFGDYDVEIEVEIDIAGIINKS
jgi:hypothetical protein